MTHKRCQTLIRPEVRDGSFASILPCPLFRPLSTTPDITTAGTRAPTNVWDRRQDKSDGVAPGRRGSQVFVCALFWMALRRHRMERPGAARTEKALKINVPSAIARSIASCCACSAGCPAMIAWEAAAMRSWLAVRDCAHAAREARGRSTAA
jgi:hypothetical protein